MNILGILLGFILMFICSRDVEFFRAVPNGKETNAENNQFGYDIHFVSGLF